MEPSAERAQRRIHPRPRYRTGVPRRRRHPYYIGSWDPFGGLSRGRRRRLRHRPLRPPELQPVRLLDSAADAGDRIRVGGWGMDPNDTHPIGIHVYVDGTFAGAGTANRSRPDVDAVFHRGPTFGYDFTVPAKAGTHQVVRTGSTPALAGTTGVGCTR